MEGSRSLHRCMIAVQCVQCIHCMQCGAMRPGEGACNHATMQRPRRFKVGSSRWCALGAKSVGRRGPGQGPGTMAGRGTKKVRRHLRSRRAWPGRGDGIQTSDLLNPILRVKAAVDSVSKATVGTLTAMASSWAAGVCAPAKCNPLIDCAPITYGIKFVALASKCNPTPSTPGGKWNGRPPAPMTGVPGSNSTDATMAGGVGAGGTRWHGGVRLPYVYGRQPDGTTWRRRSLIPGAKAAPRCGEPAPLKGNWPTAPAGTSTVAGRDD
jgi:hypothetical protein